MKSLKRDSLQSDPTRKNEAASNMEENFEKRVETQKKIPNIVVSKFLHKSGTDALRKHICTQCVLKRNTSEGEMPRAHTGAAFFHCGSWVRLQVCRQGFPLLAPVAGGFST